MLDNNLSIIIRNRNEAEHIGFALQSCLDFFPNSEVIIADNNSNDESLDIVNLFKENIDINILNIKNYSPGLSINHSVAESKRKFILILSAHCQIINIDNDIIEKELDQNIALFGKQIPIYKGKKIEKKFIWSHFSDKRKINMFSLNEQKYFLHNAFCFYKRESLIEYPFNEKLSGKEDRHWAKKIVEYKRNYVYQPNLECNHFFTNGGATWEGLTNK